MSIIFFYFILLFPTRRGLVYPAVKVMALSWRETKKEKEREKLHHLRLTLCTCLHRLYITVFAHNVPVLMTNAPNPRFLNTQTLRHFFDVFAHILFWLTTSEKHVPPNVCHQRAHVTTPARRLKRTKGNHLSDCYLKPRHLLIHYGYRTPFSFFFFPLFQVATTAAVVANKQTAGEAVWGGCYLIQRK